MLFTASGWPWRTLFDLFAMTIYFSFSTTVKYLNGSDVNFSSYSIITTSVETSYLTIARISLNCEFFIRVTLSLTVSARHQSNSQQSWSDSFYHSCPCWWPISNFIKPKAAQRILNVHEWLSASSLNLKPSKCKASYISEGSCKRREIFTTWQEYWQHKKLLAQISRFYDLLFLSI